MCGGNLLNSERKSPSGPAPHQNFPGAAVAGRPHGTDGTDGTDGRRPLCRAAQPAPASHLPCTSGRCPEAARPWGRRTCRRAPSGTAGTGGSSHHCPPRTAWGLGKQGGVRGVPVPHLFPNKQHPTSSCPGGPSGPSCGLRPSPWHPIPPHRRLRPRPASASPIPQGPGVGILPPGPWSPFFYNARPSSPSGPHEGRLLQEGCPQPSLAGSQNLPVWS